MSELKNNETTYFFATIGSRTNGGGHVTRVSTKAEYEGMALARVGDIVTYDDGSDATVIDGAGFAAAWSDKPFALVGSGLSNGDTITEPLQDGCGITVRSDKPVPSLFEPLANRDFVADIGGLKQSGKTDGQGYAKIETSGEQPFNIHVIFSSPKRVLKPGQGN